MDFRRSLVWSRLSPASGRNLSHHPPAVEDDGLAGHEGGLARGLHESGAALLDRSVAELMTAKIVGCMPETDVRDAADLMIQHRIRHLPVLDGVRPLTIVSIRDIVAIRLAALEADNEILRAQLQELAGGGG
ncbi:MAG: CBS domain-containing protein [Pseudomonadota bacterium]